MIYDVSQGPIFDVPKNMAMNIERKRVGDKIKATIDFEVMEKDKSGVRIQINNIYFKSNDRRKYV